MNQEPKDESPDTTETPASQTASDAPATDSPSDAGASDTPATDERE